jgi:hypothetical protein
MTEGQVRLPSDKSPRCLTKAWSWRRAAGGREWLPPTGGGCSFRCSGIRGMSAPRCIGARCAGRSVWPRQWWPAARRSSCLSR